jgi:hypothetical protein
MPKCENALLWGLVALRAIKLLKLSLYYAIYGVYAD